MRYHHHDFPNVEDYLHHREPYLMVQQILSIDDDTVKTQRVFSGDEMFAAGHFPGAPVCPGAMLQEFTTQTAGILIAARYNPMREFNTHDPHANAFALGVLVKVTSARFKGFARPGDTLTATVRLHEVVGPVFDFSATVSVDDETIVRNSFQLMNIESKKLQPPATNAR